MLEPTKQETIALRMAANKARDEGHINFCLLCWSGFSTDRCLCQGPTPASDADFLAAVALRFGAGKKRQRLCEIAGKIRKVPPDYWRNP